MSSVSISGFCWPSPKACRYTRNIPGMWSILGWDDGIMGWFFNYPVPRVYHLVMTVTLPWKDPPLLRTVCTIYWIYFDMGHRKTMANCNSHNQRVVEITHHLGYLLLRKSPGHQSLVSWRQKGGRSQETTVLPSGNLTWLLKMAIYSGFSH